MIGISESRVVLWPVARAAHLLRTEGPRGLARGVARHLHQLSRRVYWHEHFAIYETNTADYALGLVAPSIDGLEVYILGSESDVQRLMSEGYEDVRRVVRPAARRLQQGAVGFCAFVNREVAHVSWVAFTQEAKLTFDVLPYFVDFEGGEACGGGTLTTEPFRNRGLYRHVRAWRLRYCCEHGSHVLVDATAVNNTPSLRGMNRYNPRMRAFYRNRRFLRWREWTEL